MKVTVLGIGNILLKDEGVGIHALNLLKGKYGFPPEVELVDGGVLGLGLMGVLSDSDFVIVLDAVKNGGPPGTLYRIEDKEIPMRFRAKNSLHQVDFLESLAALELIDKRPRCVILGIEPKEIQEVNMEVSPEVESSLPDLLQMVITELEMIGIKAWGR